MDRAAVRATSEQSASSKLACQVPFLGTTKSVGEFLIRTPAQRFEKAEDLIGVAVLLASDAASYITGQSIAVDGGFLAPGA